MNTNIIKILIVANIIVLVISLSVIYFRYSTQQVNKETTTVKQETQPVVSSQQSPVAVSTQEVLPTERITPQETQPVEQPIQLRKPKFVYFSSKAKKVELIGDFNDWIPQKMKKVAPNKWELTIEIPEGKYLYNFLVDGKVVLDPNNKKPPELSPQGFKSSVLELK